MTSSLAEWRDFLLSSAHILSVHPSLLFQEAANLPDASLPSRAADARWRSGRERRPWIRTVHTTVTRHARRLTITGHAGQVHACGFSSDGTRIASTAGDGTVRLWDVETGRELLSLEADAETDWPPVFLSRNRILLHGPDHSLRMHDSISGRLVASLESGDHAITSVAVSPDERLLLTGNSEGDVCLWDLEENRILTRLREHTNWIRACVFSGDGRRFATNSWDMTARLWSTGSGTVIATVEGSSADAAQTLAFEERSGRLVVASGLTLLAMDAGDGREITSVRVLETGGTNIVFASTPAGDQLVIACAGLLRVHDAETLAPGPVLGRHESGEEVTCLAISPDGRKIASAGFDETILLWDIESPGEPARLIGHTEVVRTVAFSPDGRFLASASWDQTLGLWSIGAADSSERETVAAAYFTPRGRLAFIMRQQQLLGVDRRGYAFTDENSRLQVRDTSTGAEVADEGRRWLRAEVGDWTFAPDSTIAATRDRDTRTTVVDLDTRREIMLIEGARVECIAALPDAKGIVIVSLESGAGRRHQRVQILDMQGRERFAWYMPHDHRATWCGVAAGGRVIITVDRESRRLLLWGAEDGAARGELGIHVADPPCVVSPDGRRILTRSAPDMLHLVDALTSESISHLPHESTLLDCVISTGGKRIVSVSADGAVLAWDANDGRLIGRQTLQHPLERGVRLSPQGTRIIDLPESEWARGNEHVSQHIELRVWDVVKSRLIGRFFTGGDIRQAEWSPDGTRIAVVTYNGVGLLLAVEPDLTHAMGA